VTSTYLFDSHALLAFFQKEAGAEIVARILNEALKQNTDTLISVMNLGEIIFNSGNDKREYEFCPP